MAAAYAMLGTLDDGGVGDDDYEVDAEPFTPSSATEADTNSTGEAAGDDDDDDNHLVDGLAKPTMDDFKVENSSVEISNSSGVHIGHSITQKTDITFEKAGSVLVDRRQWNYITYPDSCKAPPVRSTSQVSIVSKVQDFNRDRYRYRLAHITPLPWCTRFSPHLENIYTSLQLVASDGFDGRTGPITIPLEQILDEKQSDFPTANGCRSCRVLIEGNPGYGKTTLTLKLASDWAARKEHIEKFLFVFLIPLRDFQGDLQSYIYREFFPQHEDEGRDDWWHYVKENQENILFILDGLDELPPEHRVPIDKLLKGNLLDKVSVVVTSRPVSSDDQVLSCFNRRIEIRGFSLDQTEQFIQNYFQVKQKPEQSSKLTSLLNGPRWCGRHLTSCPLTCLFLCVVFEDEGDEGILHKVTQIYQGLINWLVRRATGRSDNQQQATSAITAKDYERALSDFGLLCLDALSRGKTQFTDKQLEELPGNSGSLVLDLGLLIRSNAPRTTTICIPKNLCYQPIHKTFLEYLAALYLSGSVEDRLVRHFDCFQSETLTRESLNLIFKFLAGLLAENAATLFRFRHLSAFELPMITLFELLHESGATPENVRALSSILDDEVVMVRSNRIELDGWAGLLAEPDCPIRSLKFIWADTPLNNAALDRFFTAFQINRSVVCLIIMSASGLNPDENDVVAMGAFTVQALKKTQLRHFSLSLTGEWAAQVVTAVNSMLNYRYAASSLASMKINVDLGTQQVVALSQGLRQSNVKSLILSKLSCGPDGYVPIASLVKSLQHLSVSLNLIKTLPPTSAEGSNQYEEGSPEDLQTFEPYFSAAAQERAGISGDKVAEGLENRSLVQSALLEAKPIVSLLSLVEDNNNPSFKLQDGLRLPGVLAPNAIGLFKLSEPECRKNGIHSSGFHSLFTALQDPECQLARLDLTGCCLGPMDLNCLGEALRNSKSLKALRLAKLKSFDDVLPILINTNLSWLDLSSGFIQISDESIVALLLALSTCTSLVSLSLAGWKFTITNPKVMRVFDRFMKSSTLQELNLTGCRFKIVTPLGGTSSNSSSPMPIVSNNATQFLNVPAAIANSRSKESVLSQSNSSLDSNEACLKRDKEPWPNLVKLSLTETVASIKVGKDEEILTGPELLIHLDSLRNLTELSVSVRPTVVGCTPARTLDDCATKKFFSALQRRLGRKLEKLRLSFCSFVWHRPSQTSASLIRRLNKCEKLVSLELNFVQLRTSEAEDATTHWLLDTIVSGCVNLEELSLIGMTLTPPQAYNLGLQIRNRWKGQSLQIHTWRSGGRNDDQRTEEVVANLLHVLKDHSKFLTDYIGGYRGTVLVRRRKLRCGLFRSIRIGIPNLLPLFTSHSIRNHHESDENGAVFGDVEELCSSLPPGQRSLFGLTPFDYSIMLAHTWETNKS